MKKKLFLLTLVCCSGFAVAQTCTPDLSITEPGVYPDTDTNLPFAYAGAAYSTAVQLKLITDTTISGIFITVNDVTLDSVAGMPPGFAYTTNPANGVFPGGSNACASLFGNPLLSMVGTYNLTLHFTIHGTAFGLPVTQATTETGYKIKIFGPPVAFFSGTPTVICKGDSVMFDNTSTNHPTTWQWSFPGGTPSVSNLQLPPPVVYAASGFKNVTLTVNSPAGSDTRIKNSYINVRKAPAAATVSPPGNVTVCSSESVTLSANTGSGYIYQWLKNGTIISGASTSTYDASTTGDYSVEISMASGCSKTSAATHLNVSSVNATVTATGSTTFCAGESVVLTANSGTGLSYQWKKDGTNISGATTISYTAATAGIYKVKVTNSSGCTKISAGVTVTVNNSPLATITANGPLSFCEGLTVTLTANSGTGMTYQWTQHNVNIPGATGISYNATASGTYKVIVTKVNGCSDVSPRKIVTVKDLPSATVSANGPLTFCEGENVTLTANAGTGLTYQWTQHNVFIPGATGISYSAIASGTYKVFVTKTNGCSKVSSKKIVVVNDLPLATITPDGPLTFCQGQSVTLTANSGAGLARQWTQHNVDIPGATDISYVATSTGSYRVVVSNSNGCVKISGKKNVVVNCRESFDFAQDDNFALYPNPTSSVTNIDLNLAKAGMVSIKVFDLTGKLIADVAERNFEEGNHQLSYDASALTSGIYFISISTGDRIKIIKLIVNRN